MITEELKALVKEEADNIKKFATKKEIDLLDFSNLDPENSIKCIYGQMTGHCSSDRAVELLELCTKPYSQYISMFFVADHSNFNVNGSRCFSPIEYYIYQPSAKNENLINYLKGNIETLEL